MLSRPVLEEVEGTAVKLARKLVLHMNLTLHPQKIEFVYDQLDTNAINFQLQDGYLSIQTSVYLEEDEQLNEPYIEFNGQGNAQVGGVERVAFFRNKISIEFFESSPFLDTYSSVDIWPDGGVTRQMIDFFNNHLFLGSRTEYANDFDMSNVSPPVAKREHL